MSLHARCTIVFTKSKFVYCLVIETVSIIFCVVIFATMGAIAVERSNKLMRMEAGKLVVAGSPG